MCSIYNKEFTFQLPTVPPQMTDIPSEVKMRNQRTKQTTYNSTKKGTAEEFRKKLCMCYLKSIYMLSYI